MLMYAHPNGAQWGEWINLKGIREKCVTIFIKSALCVKSTSQCRNFLDAIARATHANKLTWLFSLCNFVYCLLCNKIYCILNNGQTISISERRVWVAEKASEWNRAHFYFVIISVCYEFMRMQISVSSTVSSTLHGLSGVEYSIRSLFVHLFILSHFKERHSLCTTLNVCVCLCVRFVQSLYFRILNAYVNVTYDAFYKMLFVFWLPAKIKNKHSAKSHFRDESGIRDRWDCSTCK